MRKFPPKLSRKLSIIIVVGIATMFITGGFFAVNALFPQMIEVSYRAKVSEARDSTMRVDILEYVTDYHGPYREGLSPLVVCFWDYDFNYDPPYITSSAKILDTSGNEISHEEIRVGHTVVVTIKDYARNLEGYFFSGLVPYSIQIVDSLPEAA
jgi:hypothetical protein